MQEEVLRKLVLLAKKRNDPSILSDYIEIEDDMEGESLFTFIHSNFDGYLSYDDKDIIRFILTNYSSEDSGNLLLKALVDNNISLAHFLLEATDNNGDYFYNINDMSHLNENILHLLAREGCTDISIYQSLLERGADIKGVTTRNETVLFVVCRKIICPEVIGWCIKQYPQSMYILGEMGCGTLPFHRCLKYGNFDTIKCFFDNGFDLQLLDDHCISQIIINLIDYDNIIGRTRILEYLIEKGLCIRTFVCSTAGLYNQFPITNRRVCIYQMKLLLRISTGDINSKDSNRRYGIYEGLYESYTSASYREYTRDYINEFNEKLKLLFIYKLKYEKEMFQKCLADSTAYTIIDHLITNNIPHHITDIHDKRDYDSSKDNEARRIYYVTKLREKQQKIQYSGLCLSRYCPYELVEPIMKII